MLNVFQGSCRCLWAYSNLLLPLIVDVAVSSTMDEREQAFEGPRRRDSKYTKNGWNEYRPYDSYQPNSSSYTRDRPPAQSIRRPTQSEYWDQRLSPVGHTSHDGIPSAKNQRDVSVTKGNEQRSSPVPIDVGVAVREPLLATAGSHSSTRERSERHRLEGHGKRRGLDSEDAPGKAEQTNTRSQRRKSESSKLRVQTATDDIVKHSGMSTVNDLPGVRGFSNLAEHLSVFIL